MGIDTATIQKLRTMTGAGIMDAKKALQETQGDIEAAVEVLKKQGQKIAAKKQDREANEGVIGTYVHADHKVAAMVALACETDFVAKTEEFRDLAHDIAMHITATDPLYLRPEDVPEDVIAKEKEVYREQLRSENKPEKMWEKIIDGKMKKYYGEVCLLEQTFIKDEDVTINELIVNAVAKLGENIQIKSFTRMSL